MTKKGSILLLLTAILWGSGFVAADYALSIGFTPIEINFLRLFIASILMIIIFLKKIKKIDVKTLKSGIIIGILLFLGFSLQTIGLKYTTVTNNAFITTTTNVVWVGLLTVFLFKQKLSKKSIIGIFLTMIGMYLLTTSGNGLNNISIGDLLTLLCALIFAFHIIAIDKLGVNKDAILLATTQVVVACVLSFILLIILKIFNIEKMTMVDTKNIFQGVMAILFLGIFPTTIAFLFQQIGQIHTSSSKAAIILSTEAIFGSIFALVLRNETLTQIQIIGMFLIVSAIILIEIKFKKE